MDDFTTAQTQLIHKGSNYASNKRHQFNTRGLSVQIIFISSLSSLSLLMLLKVSSFRRSTPLILSSSLIHTPTFVFSGFTHALSDTHLQSHTSSRLCLTAASNMQRFVFCQCFPSEALLWPGAGHRKSQDNPVLSFKRCLRLSKWA